MVTSAVGAGNEEIPRSDFIQVAPLADVDARRNKRFGDRTFNQRSCHSGSFPLRDRCPGRTHGDVRRRLRRRRLRRPRPAAQPRRHRRAGDGPQRTLHPGRQLLVGPGPLTASGYLPDGTPLDPLRLELAAPEPITAYALALINGVEHVLVADGRLAGRWVPRERTASR